MKTLEQICEQEPVFLADWAEEGRIGVFKDFLELRYQYGDDKKGDEEIAAMYPECKILFAYYCYQDYSGEAFVLVEQDGKLYEVNGSHCSCNGLEGQWDLEATSVEALAHRLTEGRLGRSWDYSESYAEPLAAFLGVELPARGK